MGARLAIARGDVAPALSAHGWSVSPDTAPVATSWPVTSLQRAIRAQTSPARLPAADLMTFASARDADRRALSGASSYRLRFAPGALPPVEAFWSLIALDASGAPAAADVARPIDSRSADLRRNRDGSLDVAIGALPPDDPAANWLATPAGAFTLVLRAYAPGAELREGRWRLPAIERRETAA